MKFKQGDRVITKLGAGRIVYQRMAPPDYREAEAVSVLLDSKQNNPKYAGTIFAAAEVTLESEVITNQEVKA
jgi:hypothetical protein